MRNILDKIRQTLDFLEHFDEAWRSGSLPNPPKGNIQSRSSDIYKIFDSSSVTSELFDLEKGGTWYASDLLTYILTARISISLENKLENSDELDAVNKFWLNFINYLLITNIFEPNKGVDQEDLGTGKYADVQSEIRREITREIILRELEGRPNKKIMGYIFKSGRIKGGNPVPLTKSQLKSIGKELGLKENDMKMNKSELTEMIKSIDPNTLSDWIKNLPQDSEVWEGLAKCFMPLKTPGFLVKNVGLSKELFTLLRLFNSELGYVIPLLLNSRLYTRLNKAYLDFKKPKDRYVLYPPDLLLAREGKIIGIELGRGKPDLISSFASVSGLPTIYINPSIGNPKFNVNRDFGFKCNLCFLCFTLCPKYISMFPHRLEEFKEKSCPELCGSEKARECPDSVVTAEVPLDESTTRKTQIHYQCILQHRLKLAEEMEDGDIFPLFPEVSGLEKLRLGLQYEF